MPSMRVATSAAAASTACNRSLPATYRRAVNTLPEMFSTLSTPPSALARNSGRPQTLIFAASAAATIACVSPSSAL